MCGYSSCFCFQNISRICPLHLRCSLLFSLHPLMVSLYFMLTGARVIFLKCNSGHLTLGLNTLRRLCHCAEINSHEVRRSDPVSSLASSHSTPRPHPPDCCFYMPSSLLSWRRGTGCPRAVVEPALPAEGATSANAPRLERACRFQDGERKATVTGSCGTRRRR